MRAKTNWQRRDGCEGVQLLSLGLGQLQPEASRSQ